MHRDERRPGLLGVDADRVRIDDLHPVDRREEGGAAQLALPLARRSSVNFTDSALKSSPLWNLTPLRSLTSHVVRRHELRHLGGERRARS